MVYEFVEGPLCSMKYAKPIQARIYGVVASGKVLIYSLSNKTFAIVDIQSGVVGACTLLNISKEASNITLCNGEYVFYTDYTSGH